MEKRKSRILTQFEDIVEEKKTLEENLEQVVNQVFSCVNRVKNFSDELKQKDCSLIFSYELDVLKKLTEINYELENIIERNPLNTLNIVEKKYEVEPQKLKPMENNLLELENFVSNRQDDSLVDTISSPTAGSSLYIPDNISINCNGETSSTLSDNDIQRELRNTLKKFSKKLGLNAESISSMKDYYDKPSVGYVNDLFDTPSCSQNAPDYSIFNGITKIEAGPSNSFEIPEKDTNSTITCEPDVKDEFTDVSTVQVASKSLNVDAIVPNKSETVHTPNVNNMYGPDSSSNSDMEISDKIKTEGSSTETSTSSGSCTENSTKNESAPDCQAANDDLLSSATDENSDENSDRKSKKIVYTALEKLNNYKILGREKEVLKKIMPTPLPDLKLRPSESPMIKNNFEEKNKLKKKKNKKKKGQYKEECFYELRSKAIPEVGMECLFSHVESPSEFYIHILDEESAIIDMLSEQIMEYFHNSICPYTSKEHAYTDIGTYGVAFIYKYETWFRVEIIDWGLESKCDDVDLLLVDYGNRSRVSYKNLRKITKDISEIPKLAVRCHLPLMYPPGSTYTNRLTEWPTATIDALVDKSGLFSANDPVDKYFKVAFAQEENNSVAIDLYNSQEDPEQTVGQILLDLGVAVQITDEHEEENELEAFFQDIDILEQADNINEAVLGYDPRDEARICRFTKPDGTCFKGKNCKLEHKYLPKDGFTTDTIPVYWEAMDTLQLPSMGDVVVLLITSCIDACSFFAQIVQDQHKETSGSVGYVIDKKMYSLLATMNNSKVVRTFEKFKVLPAMGEMVIAKHKYNNKWLRAVVRDRLTLNNEEKQECEVFMVDFGEYMQLPLGDLRKMMPQFLELPFQAVECYIHSYEAKKDFNIEKFKRFINKNVLYRNFIAVTMSASLPLKMRIKTFNGLDVGKTLVENGFAQERLYDWYAAEDGPMALP